MLKRRLVCGVAVVVMVVGYSLPLGASESLLEQTDIAVTNWEEQVVQARGYGVAPEKIRSESQALILAREAAITVAQRRLLGKIKGVQIDSEQRVKNAQVQSDVITKQVQGIIRGARIVKEKKIADNAYQVVMEVKFYGNNGLMKAVFPRLKEAADDSLEQTGSEPQGEVEAETGDYTGVVITTVGLQVEPALAPKIYSTAGKLIYGLETIEPQGVVDRGLVGYTRSLAAAKANSRVGEQPLILKAQQVRGSYRTDLVLAAAEARQLQQVGKRNNIFAKHKIIIVLD